MSRLLRAFLLAILATVLAVVLGIAVAVVPPWLSFRWLGEPEYEPWGHAIS